MRRSVQSKIAKGPYGRCQEEVKVATMQTSSNKYKNEVPDEIGLVCKLRSCTIQKDLYKGRNLHCEIKKTGLHKTNVFIGNTLVSMYAKCGALLEAEEVFEELPFHDIVSWTALITGYCQQGYGEEALVCFKQMLDANICPDARIFASILKACGSLGASRNGQDIHFEIARNGMLQDDLVLGSALVDMYAKCGAVLLAQQVFDELSVHNVVSWTALIAGYCQHGLAAEALACFRRMEQEGPSPNSTTFTCILDACGHLGLAEKGKQIHMKIVRLGLEASSCELGNALVNMYSMFGAITKAQHLFDELPVRDAVSWASLITGYCNHGCFEDAFRCFNLMKHEGLSSNAVTLMSILNVCGSMQMAEKGKDIHAEIVKFGFLEHNIVLVNALVDMYAKCGLSVKSQQLFSDLSSPSLVSWTSLITSYCQDSQGEKALDCYEKMKDDGVSPDVVTLTCILQACGQARAAEKGKEVHSEIARAGFLSDSSVLRSALLGMYIRCGALLRAQEVFDELQCSDVISINTLLAGYTQQGFGERALKLFERFERSVLFDELTLLCVLKAIASIGVAGMGQTHYETMQTHYGIVPTLEHHICMVDLLCRAGYFQAALSIMWTLPIFDYNQSLFVLLGACKRWGNTKLGTLSFEQCSMNV